MTLYEVLNLTRDATPEEIRGAYRALAKKYHPDLVQQADGETKRLAEERLKAINEAYTILNDPVAREKYHQVMWTSRDPARRYQKIFPQRSPASNGKPASEKSANPAEQILLQLNTLRADQDYLQHRQQIKRRRFMFGALLSTLIIFFFMWVENATLSTTRYDLLPRLGSFLFTFLSSELIAIPVIINASSMRLPRYPGLSNPILFSVAVFVGTTFACAAITLPRTEGSVVQGAFILGGIIVSFALLLHVYLIRRLSYLQEIMFIEERNFLHHQIRKLERQLDEIRKK